MIALQINSVFAYSVHYPLEVAMRSADYVIHGKITQIIEGPILKEWETHKEKQMFLKIKVLEGLNSQHWQNGEIVVSYTTEEYPENTIGGFDYVRFDSSNIGKEFIFLINDVPIDNGKSGSMPYYIFDTCYIIQEGEITVNTNFEPRSSQKYNIEQIKILLRKDN